MLVSASWPILPETELWMTSARPPSDRRDERARLSSRAVEARPRALELREARPGQPLLPELQEGERYVSASAGQEMALTLSKLMNNHLTKLTSNTN